MLCRWLLVFLTLFAFVSVGLAQRLPVAWQQPTLRDVVHMEYSRDGQHLLVQGNGGGRLSVLSVTGYNRLWTFDFPSGIVGEVRFGPVPGTIWANDGGNIREYSTATGEYIRLVKTFSVAEGFAYRFAVAPNGEFFITETDTASAKAIKVFNATTGAFIRSIAAIDDASTLQISPDSTKILNRRTWFNVNGTRISTSGVPESERVFSPDSTKIYEVYPSGDGRFSLRTLNANTGATISIVLLSQVTSARFVSGYSRSQLAISGSGGTLLFYGGRNSVSGMIAVNTSNGAIRRFIPANFVNPIATLRTGTEYAAIANFEGYTYTALWSGIFNETTNLPENVVVRGVDAGAPTLHAVSGSITGVTDAPWLSLRQFSNLVASSSYQLLRNRDGEVKVRFPSIFPDITQFSPGGLQLLALDGGTASVFASTTGVQQSTFGTNVYGGRWLDESNVVVREVEETWQLSTYRKVTTGWTRRLTQQLDDNFALVAASASLKRVALAEGDRIRVFNTDTLALVSTLPLSGTPPIATSFNAAGELLTLQTDGSGVYSLSAYNVTGAAATHARGPYLFSTSGGVAAYFSPDGTRLGLASDTGLLIIRTTDGTVAFEDEYFGVFEDVNALRFTADNASLYLTTAQGSLYSLALPVELQRITLAPTTVIGGQESVGTVTLARTQGSDVVVNLSSLSPLVELPATVTVPAGTLSATFAIGTTAGATDQIARINATLLGRTVFANLTIRPNALATFTLTPARAVGGLPRTGTVTISGLAPEGGLPVTLAPSTSNAIVPSGVRIPEGTSSVTFSVDTRAVRTETTVGVTATVNGRALRLNTVLVPSAVSQVTVSDSSIKGGESAEATIRLTGPAPSGGAVVALSGYGASLTGPATVTIPAGQTEATFGLGSVPVAADDTRSLSATFGATASANVKVEAPILTDFVLSTRSTKGGTNLMGLVTFDGMVLDSLPVRFGSSSGFVTVPGQLFVIGLNTYVFVNITTQAVTTATNVTISATFRGKTISRPLRLTR